MKKNVWPYAIVAYFVVFITGMITWVGFAMRHDDQLVRPDYYEHEIQYQNQIDRVARTRALNHSVDVAYDAARNAVSISLPPGMRGQKFEGTIHLYRPSDARLDRVLKFAPSVDGTQQINVSSLQAGLWKLRLDWKASNAEYYLEKSLVLRGM